MRQRLPVGFVLLVALMLSSGTFSTSVSAQNLAQNPGFETGSTAPWSGWNASVSVQTSVVRTDTYAAYVYNRGGTYAGIRQYFTAALQDGGSYTVSAWVRLASGGPDYVQLTMRKVENGGSAQYFYIAGGTATSTGWTQLEGTYDHTVSGALDELFLYLEGPDPSVDYYADDFVVEPANTNAVPGDCVIDWSDVHQEIDGFGASSAWRSSWTPAEADMLFSTNSGAGLSLLRTRITPTAGTWESSIMQMARDRGARVWSTPWTPPVAYKDSGQEYGGNFVTSVANYTDYAQDLADYVLDMKTTYNVDLYAISVQNEPDFNTTNYESCVWTAAQIRDFVPYLHAALEANGVGATKIMIPESIHWANSNLYTTAMNDTNVAAKVGIIGNHNYDGIAGGPPTGTPEAIPSYGKSLWETEVSNLTDDDPSIEDGVYWAGRIHLFMTVAQANAWHYWWLIPGLIDGMGNPAKRMYTIGNFSRFVRPGYHRIGASNTGSSLISAYRNDTNGQFAIVAINPYTSAVTQTFEVAGADIGTVTPWVTSLTLSLASGAAIPVSGSAFTNTIPAMSVVTYVGQANMAPPPDPPLITSIATTGGPYIEFTADGDPGPDYTVWTSTNLVSWDPLFTTNAPAMPVLIIDTNPAVDPVRFYTIEAVP